MWQEILVGVIVALAAWGVGRHLWRRMAGRAPSCCGGGNGNETNPCAGCSLAAGGHTPSACSTCAACPHHPQDKPPS